MINSIKIKNKYIISHLIFFILLNSTITLGNYDHFSGGNNPKNKTHSGEMYDTLLTDISGSIKAAANPAFIFRQTIRSLLF